MQNELHVGAALPDARRAARPWIEVLARAGYVAKGVLYLTIGVLAAMLAIGDRGGRATGSAGALETLGQQPFGEALLIAMAVGLGGHALWRLVQGTLDPEGEVRRAKHPLGKRLSFFLRAILHAGLVVFAVKTVLGEPAGRTSAQSTSAKVMAWQPLGVWLVGLAGAAIVVFGALQVREAIAGAVGRDLSMDRLAASTRRLLVRFGRFGIAARGVVFGLAGVFIAWAAITADPRQAKGLGETLHWLRGQTLGDVALFVAAVGLAAYGIYQWVLARYRSIRAC